MRKQPRRGADIIRQLKRFEPGKVWELGSGTSTGIFAAYASSYGGAVKTVEHAEEWRKATLSALQDAGLDTEGLEVVYAPIRWTERGVGYDEGVESDVEFVYVDGPPVKDRKGDKWPCIDILDALEAGARPKVIMIDGRDLTLKALLSHPVILYEYKVEVKDDSDIGKVSGRQSSFRVRPHHLVVRRTAALEAN